MVIIVSTRFTDNTFDQNMDYRKKHSIRGCIYGVSQEMSPKIEYDTIVLVIEMNNSQNKIEGIGLIKNRPIRDKYFKIYDDANYNRYVYKGDYYASRYEIERINSEIIYIFDYILFKEKTHLKRGTGFTTIPEKLLHHNICNNIDFIKELKQVFTNLYK
jgi:hypothetical protein